MGLREDARKASAEADKRVKALEREAASLRREVAKLERQREGERHLRQQVAALQSSLEEVRSRRSFSIPGGKPAKGRKGRRGAYYVRAIIPDSHGCLLDKPAANAFLSDLHALDPEELVLLGDHLDCSGFLSAHGVLGWEDERGYTYEEDIEATNTFLDAVQKAAPRASVYYLEGNHEHRVRRWATEVSRGDEGAFNRLMRAFHAEHVLHLEKRGWRFFAWTKTHMDLRHPGAIRLGRCYFAHGLRRMPTNGAKRMLELFGANVVFGHTHRRQSASARTVRDESLGAWCPGCLCQLQATYQETNVSQWQHGYGLQFVRRASGEFQHLNVPIIDGRSFMVPITDKRG